jgi:hypothetical protein
LNLNARVHKDENTFFEMISTQCGELGKRGRRPLHFFRDGRELGSMYVGAGRPDDERKFNLHLL